MARIYGDRFNFGFMDHRVAEHVFELYDLRLDYGKLTPSLIAFHDFHAYPAATGTLSPQKLAKFAEEFTTECQYCGQRIKPALSELAIYLEYAKNEVSKSAQFVDTYNFMNEKFNNTWVKTDVL